MTKAELLKKEQAKNATEMDAVIKGVKAFSQGSIDKIEGELKGRKFTKKKRDEINKWLKDAYSKLSDAVPAGEITEAKKSSKPKLPKGKTGSELPYTVPEDEIKPTQFDMVLEFEQHRGGNRRVYIFDIGSAFIELPNNATECPGDLEGIKTMHKPLFSKEKIIEEYRNNDFSLMYGNA